MNLKILYRGPLESCNYGCAYCPFAKTNETAAELSIDQASLIRFVDWVERRPDTDVLFTPWGEALVRPWYQEALARLTNATTVGKAAIQTNLSMDLGWVDACDPQSLGVWATYHPEWAERAEFVDKVAELHARGVSVSAGVVGFKKFAAEIESLRTELPGDVYLWINAPKRYEAFDEHEIERFEALDPLFRLNTKQHPSRGMACAAGHTAISVDGDGTARRCHFIEAPIGNLYEDGFEDRLRPSPCTNETCGCHIGYVHLRYLELDQVFGSGILERVPPTFR